MHQQDLQLDVQRRIVERSREVLLHVQPLLQPSCTSSSSSPGPNPSNAPLPYPSPILAPLLGTGASFDFADRISTIYLRDALRLRRECERQIQHVSHVWIETSDHGQDISRQLALVYTAFVSRYRQTLAAMFERVVELVRSRLFTSPKKDRRNTFNKSVVPILDSFYANDPFPSSEDIRKLAQQTTLTTEQVRIWFQNRRARAKRAGRPPTRSNKPTLFVACQPPSSIPSDLESEIQRLIDDEVHKSSPVQHKITKGDGVATTDISSSVLWPTKTSEHAFPTPYRLDQFSIRSDLANFDIPWLREASRTRSVVSNSTPDIADLTSRLSKLSIGHDSDDNRHLTSPVSESLSLMHPMWIPARPTLLPPIVAPVTASYKKSRSLKRKVSVRSSLREARTLQRSMSNDVSLRLKPYPRSKPQPSLPRRVPQSQPQLIPHHCPSSRSSSSSSSASDDSFSSYASSSDSELGTPPPISANLPVYLSEESSSPCISPISLPKLSRALSKSPIAIRTYTFRTTIAPS